MKCSVCSVQIGVESSKAVENRRVFVIDGDEVTRAALQFMLLDENEAHEFAGVDEAIAKRAGRQVDLVLLGQATVREQGAAVLDVIARGIPGAKVLLVAESAGEASNSAPLGAAGVIAKPLTVESVRLAVDTALGRLPGISPLRVLS